MLDGVKVGSRTRIGGRTGGTDPQDVVSPRIRVPDHRLCPVPIPQAGRPDPGQHLRGSIRHVHVENARLAHRVGGDRPQKGEHDAERAFIVSGPLARERHRNGGVAKVATLDRGGDRAGVEDIVSEVGTGIDAGDDQIGLAPQESRQSQVDAVGRRSVDDPQTCLLYTSDAADEL